MTREGKELVGYSRLYCKSWSCRYCGPRKAARLRNRIAVKAREHGLTRFLTLTLDPKSAPEDRKVRYMWEVWRKFRVSLKRKLGRTVSFISVIELHKSGYPHLHVLVDEFIAQRWISNAWSRVGGGRVVYIERVKDVGRIGAYLGKYLTKDMMSGSRRGERRYSCSRNIKLGNLDESDWRQAKFSMDTLYRVAGERIVDSQIDENGHVKGFVVAEEIVSVEGIEERLRAENERLIQGVVWFIRGRRPSPLGQAAPVVGYKCLGKVVVMGVR